MKQVFILRMKLRTPKPWLRALLTPVFRMKDTNNYRNSSGISILLIDTGYKRDLYQSDAACTKYLLLTLRRLMSYIYIYIYIIGFGGLEVACWPLVPKFAGSNPAEVVGFLRAKKSSARLPSEGK